MRKLYCESTGYNTIVFVDDDNRAVAFDCESLEEAKSMDFSGVENEDDIVALAINCNKTQDDVFKFDEDDYENILEIA